MEEWRNQWRRYRMTPEKPPDPHILWVVDKILVELQDEEKKTKGD